MNDDIWRDLVLILIPIAILAIFMAATVRLVN